MVALAPRALTARRRARPQAPARGPSGPVDRGARRAPVRATRGERGRARLAPEGPERALRCLHPRDPSSSAAAIRERGEARPAAKGRRGTAVIEVPPPVFLEAAREAVAEAQRRRLARAYAHGAFEDDECEHRMADVRRRAADRRLRAGARPAHDPRARGRLDDDRSDHALAACRVGLGGDGGARTPGLRIANATLSQLSYIPTRTHFAAAPSIGIVHRQRQFAAPDRGCRRQSSSSPGSGSMVMRFPATSTSSTTLAIAGMSTSRAPRRRTT